MYNRRKLFINEYTIYNYINTIYRQTFLEFNCLQIIIYSSCISYNANYVISTLWKVFYVMLLMTINKIWTMFGRILWRIKLSAWLTYWKSYDFLRIEISQKLPDHVKDLLGTSRICTEAILYRKTVSSCFSSDSCIHSSLAIMHHSYLEISGQTQDFCGSNYQYLTMLGRGRGSH